MDIRSYMQVEMWSLILWVFITTGSELTHLIVLQIRTFLIRNGLKNLFDDGVADYKTYFTRYTFNVMFHSYSSNHLCFLGYP